MSEVLPLLLRLVCQFLFFPLRDPTVPTCSTGIRVRVSWSVGINCRLPYLIAKIGSLSVKLENKRLSSLVGNTKRSHPTTQV